ncbi:MAG: signal peptidase I [Lachnospiraceae bacterium]|nr:signal peptidase I [Lachnospiraceae bacterium]
MEDKKDSLENNVSQNDPAVSEPVGSDNPQADSGLSGTTKNNAKKPLTPKEKRDHIISEVASWAIIIGIALILATLITKFIIIKAEVVSSSMCDTLKVNDVYLGNRLSYVFGDPERGDIVFFKYPDNEEEIFVKRVIGLPGEKLEIKDGLVYINDSETPLEEPYLKETPDKEDFGPVTIPEDGYFMLGDNRNFSKDSRAWNQFYVTDDELLAKAWLRIWPPFSIVEHHDYEEEN